MTLKKKNIKNAIIVHTVQRHTFFFSQKDAEINRTLDHKSGKISSSIGCTMSCGANPPKHCIIYQFIFNFIIFVKIIFILEKKTHFVKQQKHSYLLKVKIELCILSYSVC